MLSQVKKGFTIIEVVIVLVIGAIIMLMVFLVVPQLQRSQRDARRQSDARKYLAAVESFASNHNGTYPTSTEAGGAPPTAIVANSGAYIVTNEFKDPNTQKPYTISFSVGGKTASTDIMRYQRGATCDNNVSKALSGQLGKVAVVAYQENGGSFCVSN